MFLTKCPSCKQEAISINEKAKLLTDGNVKCKKCEKKCSVSSLMKLFSSILLMTLLPTFFLVFWGLLGFVNSIIVSVIAIVFTYYLLAYISPLSESK